MSRAEQPLIRNCRFAFRCHQQWNALEATGDPRVRYCHECSRPVVLCRTDAELRTSLEADECVALEHEHSRARDRFANVRTIGIIAFPDDAE